jgi:hypothetical protein
MKAFTQLIQRQLDDRGWTFDDLARAVAPRNPQVALRKFRALLEEGSRNHGVLNSICKTLEIDPIQRNQALRADQEEAWRRLAEEQRPHFKPHFWIEVTPDWRPSLITITGPNLYRRIAVPEEMEGLEDEQEIIEAAGRFVAAHFCSKDRKVAPSQLRYYLYRREFELGYRFTPEGGFVEKDETPYLSPTGRVRVG